MKLVTKAELLKCPVGTMFRGIDPAIWSGEWMIFNRAVGDNDFVASEVGPQIWPPGSDSSDNWLLKIDCVGCRDGYFDDTDRYIVLDDADRAAMAAQILGTPYPEITAVLTDLV